MPLISICIPTRNRAAILRRTLESIVSQQEFGDTDLFEIAVSDNCSEDATSEVIKEFVGRYPGRIVHSRNDSNIGFGNLLKALSLGTGDYLKLNNDTLVHRPGSLAALLQDVRQAKSGEVLFFPNGSAPRREQCFSSDSLDEFVRDVSYWTTWSSAFGIWRDDRDVCLRLFEEKRSSEMPHAYVLLHLVASGRRACTDNRELFASVVPDKKGGYNIAQVFGCYYTAFLQEFFAAGKLSARTLEREKFRLFNFIARWYFDRSPRYVFDRTGFWKHILPVYRGKWYIWPLAGFYWFVKGGIGIVKRIGAK